MDAKGVAGLFQGARRSGKGYTAKCPCHDDKTASLSIDQKPGRDGKERVFLYCHAGCSNEDILAAVGLTTRDLIVNPDPDWKPAGGRGRGRSGTGAGGRGTSGSGNGTGAGTGRGASGKKSQKVAGVDPETGEIFPEDAPAETGEIIRDAAITQQGYRDAAITQQGYQDAAITQQGYQGEPWDAPAEPVEIAGIKVYTVGKAGRDNGSGREGKEAGSAGEENERSGTGTAGSGEKPVPAGEGDKRDGAADEEGNRAVRGGRAPGYTDRGKQGQAGDRDGQYAGENDRSDHGRDREDARRSGSRGGDGAAKAAGGGELKIDWERPDRVYSYTDEAGNEKFQVVRYHYLNGPGKTFRQRMRPTEEMKREAAAGNGPRISRDGWVHAVPAEIRDGYLYRMPNVVAAIKDGKPVYLVEGEKDAETLERLGFCATCNPGGAGKWSDSYTRILTGADVIILPDNDPAGDKGQHPGQDHAWTVAMRLKETAKRVRLVDLKEACPELPDKGDISDMVQIMGDTEAMDALAKQVGATRTFDAQTVPFWLTPMQQAERLYAAIGSGYGAENGCIVQKVGDAKKALTDFVVIPRMELTTDDGVKQEMSFVLDGWNSQGRKLKRVNVSGSELDGMNWVTTAWGFEASLMPGTTTKNKVAWTIKKVGQMTAQRVTQYRHTGWRKIGGKWCYLYQGGAIGMDGVRVDGGSTVGKFRLDGGGSPEFREISAADGCRRSLQIREVMKREIGIALLGTMYLAPLREWMLQTDIAPSFSLFLYGETGTHKSTAAALAMSHYGNFTARNAPENFHSTRNHIRETAFLLKDMPVWVDDFHPTMSQQEKRQMNATAQDLSRAFGDGADRGRLNADRTIAEARPPRSVAMITGEDLPAVGASGLARFFIVDVDKGDVPFTKEFTQLQEDARVGYLQRAMRGYVEWLAGQTETLPGQVHDAFLKNRDYVRQRNTDGHDRAPEAVACILTGYGFMLRYMQSEGVISQKEWGEMMLEAMKAMTAASEKQTRDMESEKPTKIFLNGITELLRSNQAGVLDLTLPDAKEPYGSVKMVGYRDREYYYFLPEVTHGMVAQLCRSQGAEFPVSLKALYKHLRTDGILPPISGSGDTYTRMKWISGKATRLLWVPVEQIDGKPVNSEQQAMKFESELEAVDPKDVPEGWK